jgi:hypothetical protein
MRPLSDADLLNYVEAHVRTPRGLIHKSHMRRLFVLAGEPVPEFIDHQDFWQPTEALVDMLVAKARASSC